MKIAFRNILVTLGSWMWVIEATQGMKPDVVPMTKFCFDV